MLKKTTIAIVSLLLIFLFLFLIKTKAQVRPQITDFKVKRSIPTLSDPTPVFASSITITSGDTVIFTTQNNDVPATAAYFRCELSNKQVIVRIGDKECGLLGDGPFVVPANTNSATISLASGVNDQRIFDLQIALADSQGISQPLPYPSVTITVKPQIARLVCVACAPPPAGCSYIGGSCQTCGTLSCLTTTTTNSPTPPAQSSIRINSFTVSRLSASGAVIDGPAENITVPAGNNWFMFEWSTTGADRCRTTGSLTTGALDYIPRSGPLAPRLNLAPGLYTQTIICSNAGVDGPSKSASITVGSGGAGGGISTSVSPSTSVSTAPPTLSVRTPAVIRTALPPADSSLTRSVATDRGTLIMGYKTNPPSGVFPEFMIFRQGTIGDNPTDPGSIFLNTPSSAIFLGPSRFSTTPNSISTGIFDIIVRGGFYTALRQGVRVGSNPDHSTTVLFDLKRRDDPVTPTVIKFIRVNGADAITIPSGEAVRLEGAGGDAITDFLNRGGTISFKCAYANPANKESVILRYQEKEYCGPRGLVGLKDGPYFLTANPFPVDPLIVTNTRECPVTRECSVTVRLQLDAYDTPDRSRVVETKYAEVTVKGIPAVVIGRDPYDYTSSRITSSEPSAPQPAGSFKIFLGNETKNIVDVVSGTPIAFGSGYAVDMNPASFTVECMGNTNNLVKLIHGGVTYCGNATSTFPNGPFPIDLKNLPAEIVFLTESSDNPTITMVVRGFDTSNPPNPPNLVERSITVTVYPVGSQVTSSGVLRTIGRVISNIVGDLSDVMLNKINVMTLFFIRTFGF